LAWGDGHLDVFDLSAAVWQPPEIAVGEPVLFNGGGAELMRNFPWQQEFLSVGKSNRVNLDNLIDMRMLHPIDTSILSRDPTAEVREDFRSRMQHWTNRFANELNTTQLDMMYAYKCTGHFGLYAPAFGAYGLIQSPLFFKPIFNIAVSTNWRYRNGHAWMRRIMQRLNPKIAAITTTAGGPASPMRPTNFHRFIPYYADVGLRASNKLVEKVFGRGFLSDFTEPAPHILAARQACLANVIDSSENASSNGLIRSAALYNGQRLQSFLSQAPQPNFRELALLGRILTVELALRATDSYIDESPGEAVCVPRKAPARNSRLPQEQGAPESAGVT
jgi:hypothetical protein